MNRRELLQQATAIAAGTLLAPRRLRAQSASGAEAGFFPGFKPFTFQATGATINGVIGGSGSPVLLLHGAPQTHVSWRIVAPKLAASHTVVATDLRGYGDSGKPPDA